MLRDADQKLLSEWQVAAIPMIGVIDREGIVRHITLGGGQYLDQAIAVANALVVNKKK